MTRVTYDVVAKKTYHVVLNVPEPTKLDVPQYLVNEIWSDLNDAICTKEFQDEFAAWENSPEGQRLISKCC